ncbi:piggyBac transposable element-derived protein 4-like [Homalodisca vitripennis]|uniref:piggyBac transposable element-derived protein 4-like n=1 Tax=Homalodisca vitripennis TaxID=197043 RepID=UPI001EEC12AD|nr:piggyBac transposable element-derived protein 4-like [Homalodisca vitripennis]
MVNYASLALGKMNRTLEAVTMLERCLRLDTSYTPAYLVLAKLHSPPVAARLLYHVTRLLPNSPDYQARIMGSKLKDEEILHYIETEPIPSDAESIDGLEDEESSPSNLTEPPDLDEISDVLPLQNDFSLTEFDHDYCLFPSPMELIGFGAKQSGKRYTPTTKTEMEVFLGINILMGIKRLPSYRDYWSSEPDLNDPFISKLMPVNRFSWLLGNLHLNDNAFLPRKGDQDYDKLYKLRPFLNAIADNFRSNFIPGQVMAVDESMIKFKGRSSLKQYLPKKPIKRGYKLWMLADKSGYIVEFEVYTGKVGEMTQHDLGPTVVKNLTQRFQGKHQTVYIDNYFVSYLMEDLKSMDINACGKVQAGRKNLPVFKDTKEMDRGDYDWRVSDGGVTAIKWIDNKEVLFLSNFHDPLEITTVKRRMKDGSRVDVNCPTAVQDCNMNMNCVDKFDQMKALYEISRKSHKWWHRIFFYFVDAAIVNAYAIHNCLPVPRLDMKTFRRQVMFGLVSEKYVAAGTRAVNTPPNWKNRVPDAIRKTGSSHQPVKSTRRRCGVCSTKKKQVLTSWLCNVVPDAPRTQRERRDSLQHWEPCTCTAE